MTPKMLGKVFDSMVEHAHEAAPSECVGLLCSAVDSDVYTARIPLANRSAYPDKTFWVDPYEQFRAEQAAEQAGLLIKAVYHSHPISAAEPSDADARMAHPSYLTAIISLRDDEVNFYMPDGNGELFPITYSILIGAAHA